MMDDLETARRRLTMRSMRRGIKEMDLILSAYAARALSEFDAVALQTYEALLDESDLDIYRWVSGQAVPPAQFAALVSDISDQAIGLTKPNAL